MLHLVGRLLMPKKEKKTRYFYEDEELRKIDEWGAFCPLFSEEEQDLAYLREYLKENSIDIYCTFGVWDCFLNNTLIPGHTKDFVEYVKRFVSSNPDKKYHLYTIHELRVVSNE